VVEALKRFQIASSNLEETDFIKHCSSNFAL